MKKGNTKILRRGKFLVMGKIMLSRKIKNFKFIKRINCIVFFVPIINVGNIRDHLLLPEPFG